MITFQTLNITEISVNFVYGFMDPPTLRPKAQFSLPVSLVLLDACSIT